MGKLTPIHRLLLQTELIFKTKNAFQTRSFCSLYANSPANKKERDASAMQKTKSPDMFYYSDITVRLASPERLQSKPEASALKFGKHFTDHMLKVEYHESIGGWQKPIICPMEYISLHPAAKVLHYAIELFEGMKAYRGRDGHIRIFRPELNMERMNMSAARSGLPQFDAEELIKCMCRLVEVDQEWVPHSEAASLYLRPTFIGTEPTLGVQVPTSALLYVILCPVGPYFGATLAPVSLLADPQYTRAWPGGVGDRKMGSNYAPTIHVQREADSMGLQQVLWLYGEDLQITEAGTMNLFMVFRKKNGEREMATCPLNGLILPGITRLSILEIAREWNEFEVTERDVTMGEVLSGLEDGSLEEIFGTGTACLVSPIESIHFRGKLHKIPTMQQENPICTRLLKALTDIQYGMVDHPWARVID
ncbi:branched-chain-amino-acid aminotransferase, cytosolic [Cimex lectularius]|uniref:Branched-chain-amino-acid aminotransferase n=1 Tax=Cimex lectularius TaxID=79782 RepID=A0A8I6SNX2_CIMLE|nr:branched-chain-amino-acid aminotransferase, cytosolic [Cimex lectularius]XP_014260671.1 branched-chain-amino-acid aminotransferase, cytosolic [Cimex lectularius]XP_014260672.1 branched-chain-amino-acid aminotransferase, cytosolic [Cimex lectularius]XP_014260673.1 branched-chain-amino-acid aminotransferase, cytosolic [Cimex lectularius]